MAKIPTVKVVLINKNVVSIKVTIPDTTRYKFKTLDIKVNPKNWDKKSGTAKKGEPNCEDINRAIFEERNNIVSAFEQDLKQGIVFTENHIIKRLQGAYEDLSKDFYAFSREQIAVANYSSETRRTYKSEILKMEHYTPSLSFGDINFKWVQGYENWMRKGSKERPPNHDNTVWKSLKFINTMLNFAVKHKIIKENPMNDYDRGNYKQGIPTYLEWSEAQKIHKAILEKPMPKTVKLTGYYAMLSYYSGLRFGDAISFDYDKKVIEDTTGKRLVLYAQKNGEIVSIAFTKYIAEIVDYIRDKPLTLTNQEYNANLKIIQGIAGISKDISSHSFRHGFAMYCCELGMAIDDVQKLMGHNKRSSTEIYFRVKSKRLDEAMSKWN